MDLPKTFPTDVDYAAYIAEAEDLLVEVGYVGIKNRSRVSRKGENLGWDM
jgi:hypothetical protein